MQDDQRPRGLDLELSPDQLRVLAPLIEANGRIKIAGAESRTTP